MASRRSDGGSDRIHPGEQSPRPTKQLRLAEGEGEGRRAAKQEEVSGSQSGPFVKNDGDKWWMHYCFICEKEGHTLLSCPYNLYCPRGATVGPAAEIVCYCCGEDPKVAHPGETDYVQRAMIKPDAPLRRRK